MIVIKKLKELKKHKSTDEPILVEETHTVYKFNGNDWEVQKNSNIPLGEVYDLNKNFYHVKPSLTEEEISEGIEKISDYVHLNAENCKYFMLLNNERKDYTVFHINNGLLEFPRIFDEVIDCLKNRGEIKMIDYADEDRSGIEFWVNTPEGAFVYYFFNYQEGVLEVK